jgi:hypothetical protein
MSVMQVRASIFDSQTEREVFQELDSRLNPRLRLMAQMPLRSLITVDDETKRTMKERHWRYFLMAAVDYTFVYPDGGPLLSIEFDGIGGGYSRGRHYIPSRSTPDTRREWKMNFKLRAAARAHYPLFVISGEEVAHLDKAASLTIVDGIVGQVFSRREEGRLFQEMLDANQALIETMEPAQAHEHVQDLLLQAGVVSDLEFDPLTTAIAEETQRCHDRFGFGFGGFHRPWLYDPPIPNPGGAPTEGQVIHRLRAIATARRVGAHVGVAVGDDRYVDATVWMRNIGQEHGLLPELVIEQVAELLAIRRTIRLAEGGQLGVATTTTFRTASAQ